DDWQEALMKSNENTFADRTCCPLCSSSQSETLARKGRAGEDLQTVLCTSCGLVFSSPIPTPDEVAQFYAKEYRRSYKGVASPKLKHVYRAGMRALDRLPQVQKFCPAGGCVVDIGSGGGEFLYLLKSRGYDASGVEPDEGYGGFSIREYGIDVQIGPFDRCELPQETFDLATANHVVEHLCDPVSVFRGIWQALKMDGHFIVEVPNVESTYHAPHHKWHFAHIFNFNPIAMENLGRKTGFRVVETILQPGTQHVNVVFQKVADAPRPQYCSSNADRVRSSLSAYSNSDHYLSLMPLKRALSNLSRTWKEQAAVDSTLNAREMLDRIYGAESATSASRAA
ncbi:MAG: methyltransferase domain-containing protein, partial [Planctomycetaceae bacterium]|nr:methyltransferase domain-containing protein [Planctomycetaceae bacterium]